MNCILLLCHEASRDDTNTTDHVNDTPLSLQLASDDFDEVRQPKQVEKTLMFENPLLFQSHNGLMMYRLE